MNKEEIIVFYKLNDLEKILDKCEDDISNRIEILKIKEADDYINYLLHAIGKSFVSIREIIILCSFGFPDGALSIARNVYEQFVITLYFDKHRGEASLKDILYRYNEDYSYQQAKCLKYEAKYLCNDENKSDEYQNIINEIKTHNNIKNIKDYWWVNEKGGSFAALCDSVIQYNKEMESLLRLMHLMYKRACLSLHASCMGNRIRLGSKCAGIDMGPWAEGQEVALYLSTASLIYIVSATYQLLEIDGNEMNKSLKELTLYYCNIITERAKEK